MKQYLTELSDEEWHALGRAYSEDVIDFFSSKKVFSREHQQNSIEKIKNKDMPKFGMSFDSVREEIVNTVIKGSIHQQSKDYLAFPDKGSSTIAQYASIINAAINQNVIADDKSAPTGTYVETTVIHWLRKLTGYIDEDTTYPDSALSLGGSFVTGGVMANTIGLLAARQKKFPQSKKNGLSSIGCNPKIIVPGATMSHYSHFGSSWWLGIGVENVIEVPCGGDGKIDQAALEDILLSCQKRGEPVIAVIAVMGDSRTNTLEDLPGIYRLTQKYDTWLHADACHGGILMFDQSFTYENKHILSYSDSLSFDPHKHLGIPYSGSVVLFNDAAGLADVGSSTDITIAYGSYDVGQITPFIGSKSLDALKIYATILALGSDGILTHINKRKLFTKLLADRLNKSPYFVALHEPELFAVAFSVRRLKGDKPHDITHKNKTIHDALYELGDVVIHNFKIRDYRNKLGFGYDASFTGLGSYIGYEGYTEEDIDAIVSYFEKAYEKYTS